ncbi:DUF2306 domain-containing protein [Shimazuella kribbensis]|uniref:DUF2306 domain-containing protein n=1 Tax=Shimazuella kribbensis TaxID=139808 RepID=UPI00040F841F|nr:DUF2306 domain-containing protein [Shimazuella kribbensis]
MKYVGKIIGGFLSIIVLGLTVFFIAPYVQLDPTHSRIEISKESSIQYPLLIIHIFFAALSMAIGPFQFSQSVRIKNRSLHRILGKIYLVGILLGGLTGFGVALYTETFTREIGFIFLNILWLYSAWKAYHTIRNKKIQEHREWMIRNYGLTLVAVSARIFAQLLVPLYCSLRGVTSDVAATPEVFAGLLETGLWLAIGVHIIVSEWILVPRSKSKPKTQRSSK